MLNVRLLAQEKREEEQGLSAVLSSMGKGSLPTVSTGVRGFDEDDINNAQANFAQVEQLESFVVSKEAAKLFAQSGNLLSQSITEESGK